MNFKWLEHYNLINFESTDSTNTEALNLARFNMKNDHIIVADEQLSPRGSKGKSWVSMPGNLNMSILLTDVADLRSCLVYPFLMANAVYQTIQYFAELSNQDLQIDLKWPNDVLVNEKKVAGILVESINIEGVNYIVIGLGVNVILNPLLDDAKFAPTSLANEGVYIDDKNDLLNIIVENFDREHQEWLVQQSFDVVREKWLKHAYHLNECITITDGQKRISGIFRDINSIGEIMMELSNGRLVSYNNGDLI